MTTETELIDRESDALIKMYFQDLTANIGSVCSKCGVTQGHPLKGFKNYYCVHLTNKIDKKFRPIEKQVWERIMMNFDDWRNEQVSEND